MIAEIGQLALILALVNAIIQGTLPLAGAALNRAQWVAVARPAARGQFLFVIIAFCCLTHAYVTSDFSVANVAQNSHTLKPLLYKVSGVWGNHEGSMVLWVAILSLFGLAVAEFGTGLPPTLRARALSIQGLIGGAFLAFILFTSNPFLRLDPAPLEGNGLNPILQDPGLAFHPPFLYVGFSMAFSFAVAALIEGRVDPAWARWVYPSSHEPRFSSLLHSSGHNHHTDRATKAGNATAQMNLGEMYLNGWGIKADRLRAWVWLDRATAQGRRWARDQQTQLEKKMTPAQLAKAKKVGKLAR